jgi:hypothetical protein
MASWKRNYTISATPSKIEGNDDHRDISACPPLPLAIRIREAPHRASPLLSLSQTSNHYRPPNLHWLRCVSALPTLWTHECHTY